MLPTGASFPLRTVWLTKRVYPECARAFRVNPVGLSPEALSQSPLGILCLVEPGVKASDRLVLLVGRSDRVWRELDREDGWVTRWVKSDSMEPRADNGM